MECIKSNESMNLILKIVLVYGYVKRTPFNSSPLIQGHRIFNGGLQTLTWDWSKWIVTFRSAARSLNPSVMAVPAEESSCGEKQACSHSVNVIICTLCIFSSLIRSILLRKSFTSWSFMASSSWRPRGIK